MVIVKEAFFSNDFVCLLDSVWFNTTLFHIIVASSRRVAQGYCATEYEENTLDSVSLEEQTLIFCHIK